MRYLQKPRRGHLFLSSLPEERGMDESETFGQADVRVLPGHPAQGCRADYLQQKSAP
jgi:hypothetical protein